MATKHEERSTNERRTKRISLCSSIAGSIITFTIGVAVAALLGLTFVTADIGPSISSMLVAIRDVPYSVLPHVEGYFLEIGIFLFGSMAVLTAFDKAGPWSFNFFKGHLYIVLSIVLTIGGAAAGLLAHSFKVEISPYVVMPVGYALCDVMRHVSESEEGRRAEPFSWTHTLIVIPLIFGSFFAYMNETAGSLYVHMFPHESLLDKMANTIFHMVSIATVFSFFTILLDATYKFLNMKNFGFMQQLRTINFTTLWDGFKFNFLRVRVAAIFYWGASVFMILVFDPLPGMFANLVALMGIPWAAYLIWQTQSRGVIGMGAAEEALANQRFASRWGSAELWLGTAAGAMWGFVLISYGYFYKGITLTWAQAYCPAVIGGAIGGFLFQRKTRNKREV